MRLHRLELQAFGPFAGREEIDFEALSEAGLFLLDGETGAGKTSVLDAVCYALYGALPGAREGSRGLRSDHAAPDAAPEVVCDFTAGGRRFEVTRSPAWQRPAKRGGGTTTAQAKSLLRERIGGEWVEKSARNDEVSAELRAVLGMGKEEFTRVAMLPQGEFARFLRAKDKEREELLKRLFDTSLYASLEQELAERLASARRACEEAVRQRDELRNAVAEDATACLGPEVDGPAGAADDGAAHGEAAGGPSAGSDGAERDGAREAGDGDVRDHGGAGESDGGAPDAGHGGAGEPDGGAAIDDGADDAFLDRIGDRLAKHRGSARSESESTHAGAERARADLDALQRRRERHARLAELRARRAAHAATAATVAVQREQLEAHARAERVRDAAAGLDRAEASRTAAAERLAEAEDAVGSNPLATSYLDSASDAAAAQRSAADAAAVVQAAVGEEQALRELRRAADASRAAAEAASVEAAGLRERQRRLEVGLPALRADLERANALAAARQDRAADVERARGRHAAAEAAQECRKRSAAAEQEWVRAQGEALAARDEAVRVGRARWARYAAALAAELEPGTPCPVCGGTEHPEPTRGPDGPVSEADEERARAAAEAKEAKAEVARAALASAREEESAARARADDTEPAPALEALRAAVAAERAAAEAAERAEAAAAELSQSESALESLAARVAAAEREHDAHQVRAGEAERASVAQGQRLVELRDGYPDVAARHRALDAARRLLGDVAEARDRLTACESTAREAAERLDEALEAQGFPGRAEADQALLARAAAAEAAREVAAFDREESALDALSGTAEVAAALQDETAGIAAPSAGDVEAAEEAAVAARAAATSAAGRMAVLDDYARRFTAQSDRLRSLTTRLGPLLAEYDRVRGLADVARGAGENRYRMSLSTYVLAARLEDVAAAATERLQVMTAQRYSLVHHDAGGGRGRGGLGLQVVDAWTGQRRDTATLSGGESFMASLALALGLADTVQHRAGGIDMETLFVDEGFGSLDAGTLELVMDALDGLRRGGRVVGLVSHVAEMKQRIPTRLHVRKGRDGSTIDAPSSAAPAAGGLLPPGKAPAAAAQ